MATALSEGEAKRKHCFILEVNRDNWRLEKQPLRTVRPFQFDSVRDAVSPSVRVLQVPSVLADWRHLLSCTPKLLSCTLKVPVHH